MIRMLRQVVLLSVGLFCASATEAQVVVDDCVVFREGGDGRLLRTPTYWLKGRVASVTSVRHLTPLCPVPAKPPSAYSREERVLLARAAPCVHHDADIREVELQRAQVVVEAWETPWSNAHGSAGLLFRGAFLGQTLVKGEIVELAADWLERCKPAP